MTIIEAIVDEIRIDAVANFAILQQTANRQRHQE